MNNFAKKTFIFILSLTKLAQIHGYSSTFINHTDKPIAIAIQFRGAAEEPRYPKLIKPQSRETFEEGNNNIPAIKVGFCIHHIFYIKEPVPAHKKNNYAFAPWKEITINWVDTDSDQYNELIEAGNIAAIKQNAPKNKNQSLCRDREFDIIENEYGKLFLTSLVE